MLCVLCLSKAENFINIFDEEGTSRNINEIITKHFWLQPNKSISNAKAICTSCWNTLNSFHEFYVQIEKAHKNHQEKIFEEKEEELKLENVLSELEGHNNDVQDGIASDFLDSDIKLEVREDIEIRLNPTDDYLARDELSRDVKSKSQLQTPPASSTRSRKSIENLSAGNNISSTVDFNKTLEPTDHEENCISPEWQNDEDGYSDDSAEEEEDSDYEESVVLQKLKKSKQGSSTKEAKKRGRRKKGSEFEDSHCNKKHRSSNEQNLKRKRMQEFDEIIAKNMKLSCAICRDIIYPDFATLQRHFRNVHNESGYVVCCARKFRKRGVLVDHICTHQNPEYFKCEKCGKVSANRKCLDSHMLIHDTEKQRIYQCDQCTLSFYTKPLLTRHMQIHISERNIKCPDCDKFFSTKDILRTHINNVHNAAYTRICDQCGKSFRRPDAFKRHLLEHDGITQPMVPCEKCNVKLTSKYGLKRHMESMHPKQDVKHVCNECGKVAPSAAALQRHVSYMHKMERKYKCPMCDKAFKKTGQLKEHMTTHTGEVLYTCPHCPKTFNSNANMHSHRKKMHRKEWEENRRHPHLGTSANAAANRQAMANQNASEDNNTQ